MNQNQNNQTISVTISNGGCSDCPNGKGKSKPDEKPAEKSKLRKFVDFVFNNL